MSPSRKLALVVDDDDHIREVLQTLLETSGFQVDTVSDGIDVVKLKKEYDVILLDMKMPIFDAGSLTDYWRLTDPAILKRVILLSGYSRLATDRDFGTYASVAKPFDYEELLRTVEACVRQGES
ncbi:MAG: two-component system, cell cycle sensor histidine kinase and response regulator CckA [Thermoanaerobaculia bacterium]|jgi:CheY-like chemotaxis protein|nr:two-component system, cell cycle sensor histidine kinase and response regulator CckA [Thermoanaerobaculia bacterium]